MILKREFHPTKRANCKGNYVYVYFSQNQPWNKTFLNLLKLDIDNH